MQSRGVGVLLIGGVVAGDRVDRQDKCKQVFHLFSRSSYVMSGGGGLSREADDNSSSSRW